MEDKSTTTGSPRAYANRVWLRCKNAWAAWMARRFARLGKKGQYMAFALFVGISLSCCLFVAMGGIGSYLLQPRVLRPKPIARIVTDDGSTSAPTHDPSVQVRLRAFRLHMDSLARSPSGRRDYDSIVSARPGLLDSLRALEMIIYNNEKE